MLALEQLDDKQREAVDKCIDTSRRITAVTGPAGSGKTTIMRLAVQALQDAGYTCVLVAPTGKAARRIREATGLPAMTIHMLLEYTAPQDINPKTGKPFGATYPRRDKENPIEADFIFGDEYAMVPHELHRNLLDAFKPGACLRAFGDIMQLPPIEAPHLADKQTPFAYLLARFDGVTLTQVHRQAEDSDILTNAQRILRGLSPSNKPDFRMIITHKELTPVAALESVLDACDWTALNNQIITPSNKSWIGTHKLNQLVQNILMESDRPTIPVPRRKFQGKQFDPDIHVGVGDKVIMTKNWYGLECLDGTMGVMNGETGRVIEISDLHEIVVDFEDRICRIPPALQVVWNNRVSVVFPQYDLLLAYAVTTHKAQGSEYDHVAYILDKSVTQMLNRRNLYTGITRARHKVFFITDMRSLGLAVTTKEPRPMYNGG